MHGSQQHMSWDNVSFRAGPDQALERLDGGHLFRGFQEMNGPLNHDGKKVY